MGEQLIISVGREFGSAGHVVAEKLAKHFDLKLYDRNLLKVIAEEKDISHDEIHKYDEKPRLKVFTRKVKGYSSSAEENVANMQFEFLKAKADAGESFVVVGRCAEHILKGNKSLVSIFILGDMDVKAKRVMAHYNIGKDEAIALIHKEDKKRKNYHNYYCKGKWGDSRCYDVSINSSRLGVEETTRLLVDYIEKRQVRNHHNDD